VINKLDEIKKIIRRWKLGTCPVCGKEGEPNLFKQVCSEHGEYWDNTYLEEIEKVVMTA